MENTIIDDGSFAVFKQRELQRGTETICITLYKGFEIRIRTYCGISYKIYGFVGEKRKRIAEKHFNYYKVSELLERAKRHIDENSVKLNEKLNKTPQK